MKLKLSFFIWAIFLVSLLKAQTFTGGGGSIPDSGAQAFIPINVSGVGNINSSIGLSSVCITITHSRVSDLEIYLIAPDGTTIPLSIQNGGSGDNFNGTCFSGNATMLIMDGIAPFNGTYKPDGYMGLVNNGQTADGVWNLYIKDITPGIIGSLSEWSISFSNAVGATPPSCNGNLPPGNTCGDATPVCSFSGFCGTTSQAYTPDSWPELDSAYCGTIENNAFVSFIATGYEMNFNVWVTSSLNHDGIQMFFFGGGCGSGPVTDYGCYSPIHPGSSPTVVSATGLTRGNTYYLMIDGYAGDVCDYVISPLPDSGGLSIHAPISVCHGQPVQLTATGGDGVYTWSGPGLSAYTGSTVTALPDSTSTYSVSSVDPGGMCPVTKQVNITVMSLTPPPTVPDTLSYCHRATAPALIASGSGLLWYIEATGGAGSQQAIIPSTEIPGVRSYYVTQTTGGCESQRKAIHVLVRSAPALGPDRNKLICLGTSTDLTREFDTRGVESKWQFNGNEISLPRFVSTAGIYKIEVNNHNECSDTAVVYLSVQPLLNVYAGNDTFAVKGMPHQLYCSRAAFYSWTPAGPLNLSSIQNPLATLNNDQQFILHASDAAGCTGSDTLLVKVYEGPAYYIPNAFTPNGDGLNDIFRAIPVGITHTETCRIINRFGNIVFESTNPYKGWDGTWLNTKQPTGTYVWFIKGTDKNRKKIEKKGTVVLIR